MSRGARFGRMDSAPTRAALVGLVAVLNSACSDGPGGQIRGPRGDALGGSGGTAAGASGAVASGGAASGGGGGAATAGTGAGGAAGSGTAGTAGSGPSMPSSGCGVEWTAPDAELEESRRGVPMLVARREIAINGVQRLYLLAVPPEYDPNHPYPFVFGFHGSGGDREQLRGYMDVEAPAASQAIFIYPEGLVVNDSGTGWELSGDSDDLAFVDALLTQYKSELCIDEKRVFATGHSFGGCMSNTVGCYRGTEFRAIAPVAGCSGGGRNASCTGRIASLQIHSPKDTSTDYGGAVGACTRYLRANTCDEMPSCGCHFVDGLEDPADECVQEAQEPYATNVSLVDAERDEQPAIARSYLNCDPGYPVVFVDHWRREREEVGDPSERWHNPPPWTGALIWEFFSGLPMVAVE